jgi:hypothetical protein
MKGCSDMARFEDERGRSSQMYWGEPQGNGHRRRPAAQGPFGPQGEYGGWGSGEFQGEYGGQGYGAMGEFTGRGFAGPGHGWQDYDDEGYSRQGMGWQQRAYGGPAYGEEGPYGAWRGPGYGAFGPPRGPMREAYYQPGFAGPGRGWPMEMGRRFAEQRWGGRGAPSSYWGQGRGDWEVLPGEPEIWDEGPYGGEGYGGWGRERMGPMGMFPETMTRGPHFGRGPRGYQRSDSRIEEDVNDRLTRHPMLDASDIEVRVAGGEVKLSGMVDSRHAKRLAEDILDTVSGVKDVSNQLRVRQEQMERGETAATTGAARSQSRSQAPRGEPAKAGASRSQAA